MRSTSFKLIKWITSFTVLVTVIFLMGGCVPAIQPPVITNIEAEREVITSSGVCQIECIASDEDGDELSYEWSANGGDISGTGSVVTWTAPKAVGTYDITVKVSDGNGGEVTDSITIAVKVNHPPTIEEVIVTAEHRYLKEIPEGYKVLKGKSYDLEGIASDPEGGELSYEWSADGGEISGEGPVVAWKAPVEGGEVTITVTVSDAEGNKASKSIVFRVETCAPCAFR